MTATRATAALPERFNFAQHLITLNAGRSEKIAYIDNQGTLTYCALADRIRRCAAALSAMGVRREERVMVMMHDCNDWPVAFFWERCTPGLRQWQSTHYSPPMITLTCSPTAVRKL